MSDGQFPALVSKDRDVNALANPIFVTPSDGTNTPGFGPNGETEVIQDTVSATVPVPVSATEAANSSTNPIYVTEVISGVSANEIHDFDTAVDVASAATSDHTYTVTGTTFLLRSVIVSGSGNLKAEIQYGPTASLSTVAVVFLNGRQGDTQQINFSPAIEVPLAGTGIVNIVRTNRQGSATDVYSTIIGNEVA